MKRRPYTPSLGSISEGTLRPSDLLMALADELECFRKRGTAKLIREAREAADQLEYDDPDMEIVCEADDLIDELDSKLNELAPPFMYFGASEGDGACFGWWAALDSINELPDYDDTGQAARDRRVGEFRVVSDHGNVEVYVRHRNGRISHIIGVV